MFERAIRLFLAAGLAFAGAPARAAQGLPNSISGTVPGGVEGVASAVLQDAAGRSLAVVPLADGRFVFRNVAPGDYFVALFGASGQRIARSCSLAVATGAQRETSFDCLAPAEAPPAGPAAPAPASAAAVAGRGGMGTTGWVLVGAALVGITTAVVIATNGDEGPASPTR
jgi:hypothetical protein